MKILLSFILGCLTPLYLFSYNLTISLKVNGEKIAKQDSLTKELYIATFKYFAVEEMFRTGIPASITLAQGLYESGFGNSRLALEANNHFGIKCKAEWTGPYILEDDDEHQECFRKYSSSLESYKDHSEFLMKSKRYTALFELNSTDYKGWALGLKKAGYATNPHYSQKLIKIIEEYKLHELDLVSMEQFALMDKPPILTNEVKKEEVVAMINNQPASDQSPAEELNISYKPGEVIQFNGLNAVVAEKDDSYLKIAHKNKITLWNLYEFNDLKKSSVVRENEILYLQSKRNSSQSDFHIVAENETMQSISQKYGIKLNSLYKKNRMEFGSEPVSGQQLSLRKKIKHSDVKNNGVVAVSSNGLSRNQGVKQGELSKSNKDDLGYLYYSVKDGDTIYSIASKHGLSVDDIRKFNDMKYNYVNSGDVLIVGEKVK